MPFLRLLLGNDEGGRGIRGITQLDETGINILLEMEFHFLSLKRSKAIRRSIGKSGSRNKINRMFNGKNGG
jgi:hypothetical protein